MRAYQQLVSLAVFMALCGVAHGTSPTVYEYEVRIDEYLLEGRASMCRAYRLGPKGEIIGEPLIEFAEVEPWSNLTYAESSTHVLLRYYCPSLIEETQNGANAEAETRCYAIRKGTAEVAGPMTPNEFAGVFPMNETLGWKEAEPKSGNGLAMLAVMLLAVVFYSWWIWLPPLLVSILFALVVFWLQKSGGNETRP